MFPKGASGNKLVQAAIAQELMTTRKVAVKVDGRKTTLELGELTEKGRKHVLEAGDPKAVLEALLPAVQALANRPTSQPNAELVRTELQKASDAWVKAINEGVATLQKSIDSGFLKLGQSVVAALAPSSANANIDPQTVLAALRAALGRVTAPINPPIAVETPGTPPPASPASPPMDFVEGAVLAVVEEWSREKSSGCPFDVLMARLKVRNPAISVGSFHDALRKMHETRRIRLSGWPKALDEMPDPELALFISSKVMYYASPS
jgi:hypothetical protein